MDNKAKLKALIKSYVREALQEILVEPLVESVKAQERRPAKPRRTALDELYEEELGESPRQRRRVSEGSSRAAGRKATAAVERALAQKRGRARRAEPQKSEAQLRAERIFGSNSEFSKLFEGDAPPLILDEHDPRLGGGFDGNMVGPRIKGDDFDALVDVMGDTWGKLVKSNKKDPSLLSEAANRGARRVEPEPVFEDDDYEDEEDFDEELNESEGFDDSDDFEGGEELSEDLDSEEDDAGDFTEEELAAAEAELEREEA